MSYKFDKMENTAIDSAMTRNELSPGCTFIVCRTIEKSDELKKEGKAVLPLPVLKVTYEVFAAMNSLIFDDRNVVDFFSGDELTAWKQSHGIFDS